MLIAAICLSGCFGPYVARSKSKVEPPARGKGPDLSGVVVVHSPRAEQDEELISPPTKVETWLVQTRASQQVVGESPWPSISVARFDDHGGPLHGSEPDVLVERMTGRPVVILVHGNGYWYRDAAKEAIEVRTKLEAIGGLTPESLFIIYDWPSERENFDLVVDLNEKSRRARIASYHLARFLQAAPPASRICLMGHSDGGRIILTTTHLLSGAETPRFLREPAIQLETGRPDLRIRCIAIDAAAGHDWLNPGNRLQYALPTCEAFLNLPNRGDYVLAVFALGQYTGLRGAIGRTGLTKADQRKLGPLMEKVEQIDHHEESGLKHTFFQEALDYPRIAPRIAAYTSWGDIKPGRVASPHEEPGDESLR